MKKPPLWQVSVSTAPALEEIVSIILEQLFQNTPSIYSNVRTGKTVVTVYQEQKPTDAKLAVLKKEISSFHAGLKSEIPHFKSPVILVKKLARENWAESWKRHFKPINVAGRLLIKPGWSKREPLKNQAVVILDPGLSFGTGHHATTMFCLRQIVAQRKTGKQTFLDIGSGSGILSIAAAKLGYTPIESFDFDPEAVRVSRENVRQNKVQHLVRPRQKDLTTLPPRSTQQYDLICANLIYDLLVAEAERIVNRLKPDGNLILAGILRSQFSRVQKKFESLGLKLFSKSSEKEWKSGQFAFRCLSGRKSVRGKVSRKF